MNDSDTPLFMLRDAVANDQKFLYHLLRVTMREHVISTWGSWDEEWQQHRFANSFLPERWQIIHVDNCPIGGICLEQRPTELFLANLHLLPEWQGKGIGSVVIRTLMTSAAAQDAGSIGLNVLRSNGDAKRLYERLGFHVTDEDADRFWMKWAVSTTDTASYQEAIG